MTAKCHLRGHPIEWDMLCERWIYSDTRETTIETWKERACGHCGEHNTPEGHDACLGTLPGVMNACCGHGSEAEAYIQWTDGSVIRGPAAAQEMAEMTT